MIWKPHLTVAAVMEKAGRFLLVQEQVAGQSVYNQPAGHLEDNDDYLSGKTWPLTLRTEIENH